MNPNANLTVFNRDGKLVTDSREIAAMVGKQHKHLLRDIDGYVAVLEKSTGPKLDPLDFFIPGTYEDAKGETRRKYDCTRKGCDMIAHKLTGEKGILFTAVYVTKFEEMERKLASGMPRELTRLELIELAREAELARLEAERRNAELQAQIEADKPKVVFAEAVQASDSTILVRELAVILRQNGIDIGEKRLFERLREMGYLVRREGSDRNTPTQRAVEQGLFVLKETPVTLPNGNTVIAKTPKVTAKGQIYFVNLFKREMQLMKVGDVH